MCLIKACRCLCHPRWFGTKSSSRPTGITKIMSMANNQPIGPWSGSFCMPLLVHNFNIFLNQFMYILPVTMLDIESVTLLWLMSCKDASCHALLWYAC